ncbi:MAG: Sec-independent protein translocase subunit TatB [Streptosporangiaceae bacterium]|nr:Sec-independent protein translocase subunit TatB [Streptosporangiaceae bacterium]MBV9853629.1 Sec-independent protein translocase subunit TatB [Streptosporangiaceae bacterium]
MFDLSITKLLVLGVIALVIFGPHELPKLAAQAGRALRDLRRIAEGAKADLKEGLGPEFADFDLEDLNPRRFVQKHLFDEFDTENGTTVATASAATVNGTSAANGTAAGNGAAPAAVLSQDETPPYDPEST